ncbi:lipoyl(octanoyl) transferase [Caldicoprobacter guelmensis]|uniref:lipoyl(octanoyl) transferase LipB n=1 Tax=Caldicoprobacter guelmensis TaxID=1170224 RepID=UPI00195EF295|nr:lipoyl(octanoyl) transferase LipB [Caldicoprobacter guelmensis]MBM7581627.1 lipoyl(octanoyl) transferase [Caldicoprobacter guelmensis]
MYINQLEKRQTANNCIQMVFLGMVPYEEGLTIQEKLVALRQKEKIEDVLLLLEHPPVITVGRRGKQSNILLSPDELTARGVKVYYVDRGGDVTYHGPGQIVGYPILNLKQYGKDIRSFVWNVEEVFIQLLKKEYGIAAGRNLEYRGVWVKDEKITSIGFAIKQWVTKHGFAFNVNTNLEHFKWIHPCGITDCSMTSLEKILGYKQDMTKVMRQVASYFGEIFQTDYRFVDKHELDNWLKEA